jgi:hypothetical protein
VGVGQNVGELDPRLINAGITSFSMWTVTALNAPLPVELSSFTALAQKNGVVLNWKTATEVMNYGFDIERMSGNSWEKIGFVEGHGNSNSVKSYSFTDKNILAGKSYSYRLKQLDTDGKYEYSKSVEVTLAAPKEFKLMQNHPNPFNPATTIVYSIPQAGNVSLKIYDIIGNEIAELVNEKQAEGSYEVSFNASNFPSGMYLYKLETSTFSAVKKMLLVK